MAIKWVMKRDIAQKQLKEWLKYNPHTGIFTWILYKNGQTSEVAGFYTDEGYQAIGLNGSTYLSHRLAWLYMEGYWPEHQIDHINRIRGDNRWCNLRHVTQSCNLKNQDPRITNKTGIVGVSYRKQRNLYQASVVDQQKRSVYLGSFKNFDDAVRARWEGEVEHGYSNCISNSTAYLYLITNNLIEVG